MNEVCVSMHMCFVFVKKNFSPKEETQFLDGAGWTDSEKREGV